MISSLDNRKSAFFLKKIAVRFAGSKKSRTFASQLRNKPTQQKFRESFKKDAQMAESVDALVSNTSGFTSIPVRPRVWVRGEAVDRLIDSLYYLANKQIIFPQAQKI